MLLLELLLPCLRLPLLFLLLALMLGLLLFLLLLMVRLLLALQLFSCLLLSGLQLLLGLQLLAFERRTGRRGSRRPLRARQLVRMHGIWIWGRTGNCRRSSGGPVGAPL